MNEAETRAELIDPALREAGWGVVPESRVRREVIAPGAHPRSWAASKLGYCGLCTDLPWAEAGSDRGKEAGLARYRGIGSGQEIL